MDAPADSSQPTAHAMGASPELLEIAHFLDEWFKEGGDNGAPVHGDTLMDDERTVRDAVAVALARVEERRQETEANARLLHAAPELLAALRDVVAIADRETEPFIRARAILARVEG